ncbi:helix-turn-helix domain-containing protein [Pedobacter deserti]|uniref:helix-turn-helix domain-containing protein n=1 Tax=Pedobacter deserti TaxID=2817382 RepID=UPI0021087557|nr:helix-turn-helix domain-containing protein [Pedobacter sp. SYSU D00382]
MKHLLEKIIQLLETHFEELRQERQETLLARNKDVWLDSDTVQRMLRVTDRTLFNYIKQGKLVSVKRGHVRYFQEASVLALMEKGR